MRGEIQILPMKREDIPQVVTLYIEGFKGAPWHERWDIVSASKKLLDFQNTPACMGFVARDSQRQIAVAMAMGAFEVFEDRRFYFMKALCVHPKYRRQGIAAQVVDVVKSKAKERGAISILLFTERNSPADNLYRSHGFREMKDTKPMILEL